MATPPTEPRIVVVQAEGPAGWREARVAVATQRTLGVAPELVVVAKLTLGFDAQELDGACVANVVAPEPPCLDVPSALPGAADGELAYSSDFVPRKVGADVMLVGHARPAEPCERVECRITVGTMTRSFVARSPKAAAAIALTSDHLAPEDDGALEPCGPRAALRHLATTHGADFDFARYNSASACQRLAGGIAADARIELVGPRATPLVVQLPGLAPRAWTEATWWGEQVLDLVCDTLWIDADACRIVLTWRGRVEVIDDGREIGRLVIGVERATAPRDRDTFLADLQRGSVTYAVREADVVAGATPPDDDGTLTIARYETWGSRAPEPRLLLEDYAAIAAEVAESGERREQTLARYGLDADRWVVEERAWLEKLARDALEGDVSLAADLGVELVKAQDALASPGERQRTAADYAAILTALESTLDPSSVLDRWHMTLAEWLRLDRRMRRAAAADPRVAEEIATARREAERGDD